MNRKSIVNICSLLIVVLLAAGCNFPSKGGNKEEKAEQPVAVTDSLRFDPLELAEDREVVPEAYPIVTNRQGGEIVIVGETEPVYAPADSTGASDGAVDGVVDSLGGQVFKVQLFTSKLFGEAKRARRVAEEIFDRPVTMDYEVPYFKVRVGSFADRYEAEGYAQRVRAAGYGDAWVVAATVGIRKAAPLYDEDSVLPGFDDTTGVDVGYPDEAEDE